MLNNFLIKEKGLKSDRPEGAKSQIKRRVGKKEECAIN